MENVRQSMNIVLRQFINQPVTLVTKMSCRDAILGVLHRKYNEGLIDSMPLVDINHETEIAHWQSRLSELNKQYIGNGPQWAEAHDILNRMSIISTRISTLEGLIKDPNSMAIFLKNKDTFEPYVWYGLRSTLDH